ncbi:MAG: hypothetical protein UT51_C0009G0018 [Candidatus Nomurabacteria bacterium GW2011_GWC2_39_41]|uniref:DUF5681 domain-containing protein n=1 Tax=Candidatus Nomurabacteria bacterium GW2011_GWC2_39_41 TaxID=1618754 RepID=A0A837HQH9_9BACT|nr:MAG: hypothetical protein UT51_C0009G0018 [Candidatus Nomurabacteria bacterium GW2011_GWC2_39_41]
MIDNCQGEEPETTGKIRNEKGQFVPGVSGNPAGRPKGQTIKNKIKLILEEGPGRLEEFVERLIAENPALVWQMLEGKPPQDLNLGSNPDLPFTIKIIRDERENNQTISDTV